MIIKTGIDVIEVSRIEENITKFGNSFLNRIYTDKEIEYCESKKVQKYQSYAGRFAAKEAIFKAVSECLDSKFDIEWKDIEILSDENGRPYVNFYGKIATKLYKSSNNLNLNEQSLTQNNGIAENKAIEIDVSISHVNTLAVANAVIKMEVL